MAVIISWIKTYNSTNDGEVLSGQDLGDFQTAINNHDHTFATGTFLSLSDVPNSYGSFANNFVKVNPTETGLVFTAAALNLATEVTGVLPVANGGTGANDAATARANLGMTIGTNVLSPTGDGSQLTGITHASAGFNSGSVNSIQYVTKTITSVTKTITAGRKVLLIASGYVDLINSNGVPYTVVSISGQSVNITNDAKYTSFSLNSVLTGLSGSQTFNLSVVGVGGAGQYNSTAYGNLTVFEFNE